MRLFSVTNKPPPIPNANSAIKAPPTKAPKPASALLNSTTNPSIVTTHFTTLKTRAASEPKESTTTTTKTTTTTHKLPSLSPAPTKRLTPTPPPPPPSVPITNGHKKKTSPPGTVLQQKAPSPEKLKPSVNKPLPSPIFVPPPTIPTTSNRSNNATEVGRVETEDLPSKELTRIYEGYVNDLIEEVIQSDFEKPSIPEVILAVITDLTNDDEEEEEDNDHVRQHLNGFNQIYNFNQDKGRSSSPTIYHNNGTNGDIDHYYTRVHQSTTHLNGVNNHDLVQSTNSSSQGTSLTSANDSAPAYSEVKFQCLILF